ncbi:MAG: hypothetical protein LH616_18070 [Ilumatobacteraceae bacterium]|nr:hypothetical protein [Ilumatobacteraceae bacterium]
MMNTDWQPTACILCECNCGIEVRLGEDGHTFDRIRGDKAHPASQGYTCEKALRLNHYQNGTNRLLSPLRPVRRAGFTGEGLALGEALFDGIVAGHHGITFSADEWADVSPRVQTDDGLIHVHIAEMVEELRALAEGPSSRRPSFPWCSAQASGARSPPTPSLATRRGANAMPTVRCASAAKTRRPAVWWTGEWR